MAPQQKHHMDRISNKRQKKKTHEVDNEFSGYAMDPVERMRLEEIYEKTVMIRSRRNHKKNGHKIKEPNPFWENGIKAMEDPRNDLE